MKRFTRPSWILGLIALVLALSGSAYAGSKITGAQIKDSTITGKDIKNGSIGPSDLSYAAQDGMQGPAGPAGPAGAPGVAGVVTVESTHIDLAPGAYTPQGMQATCPPGKVVIGTGYYGSIAHTGFVKAYGTFVSGFISNDTGVVAHEVHFQAICASASGAVASSAGRSLSRFKADHSDAVAAISCKKANVAGQTKCLGPGQFCATRNEKYYRRAGFTCKGGRLRYR